MATLEKVTLGHIARELNISLSSAGRALSDRGGNTRISEETRRRVHEVAQRLNYRSHGAARAMATRRFNNVGIVVVKKAARDYTFADPILDGLTEGASEYGQNLILMRLADGPDDIANIPKALREQCLDALIVHNVSSLKAGFREAIEASEVPIVYLNENMPTNAVYMDDVAGGRMMTEHLLGRGFRRIAMLAPESARLHYSSTDRVRGYTEVMRAAGLEPEVKQFPFATWRDDAAGWLASPDRPEAVFCRDDMVALSLQRVLYRLRLRVPDDIAITGCNGEELSLQSTVPLTTLEIKFREMASAALRMAVQLVGNRPGEQLPSEVFVPDLIVDESSRRVRA